MPGVETNPDNSILRILDANANRAREGLRVVEDYARFVLDGGLCQRLKDLRHELTAATKPWVHWAILRRDTPGDVGTTIRAEAPAPRTGIADVVTAAGKRLGEAMRAMEEYLKPLAPADAARIETCRYRFYDLEQAIARTLCPGGRFDAVRLCVLITQSVCKRPWLEVAQDAILGGADCLQLREKELDGGELLRRAAALVQLCRKHGVLSIINDRPDVAILAHADGVHVGQDDLPAAQVRKLLGPDKIVGVSTHQLDQARQAVVDGATYIGVGPIFPSQTKPRDSLPGLEYARQAAQAIAIPALAISGINAANVDDVLAAGLKRIAVTAAITAADDVRLATQRLKDKLFGRL